VSKGGLLESKKSATSRALPLKQLVILNRILGKARPEQ